MPSNRQNETASGKPRLKARVRLRPPISVLFLACAFAALVAGMLWPTSTDHQLIRAQRYIRATLADFGIPFPGTPDLADLEGRLKAKGLSLGAPVFMRIFKREFQLELWMQRDGRFHHFATYPICRWSGHLGPKLAEGDRQAPEGFYTVDKRALNPNSRWHKSFNLGFPNAFDKSQGRTGSFLMVHGGCASIGCFAMTDAIIDEIWQLVTAALGGRQTRFQVQVLPFRLTESALKRHGTHPDIEFWRNLKLGYDMFEAQLLPPKVSVCDGRYVFEPGHPQSDGSFPIETRCASTRSGA